APIGIEGVSGSDVRMPALRAVSLILARPTFGLPLPTAIDSFTATTLIERFRASVSVIEPEKPPPQFLGHQLPIHTGESTTIEVGLNPFMSAVAYTYGLNEDPGWRIASVARLN